MRVRHHSPQIKFNIDSTWAWSLRIYDEHRLVGVMQAASPLLCLNVVEPYFVRGGMPDEPYRVLLCCNSNHKRLKLDHRVFPKLRGASDPTPPTALIEFLSDHFDRDLEGSVDGSCVTVMTNEDDEVVDAPSLLKRVFGLDDRHPGELRQRRITTD